MEKVNKGNENLGGSVGTGKEHMGKGYLKFENSNFVQSVPLQYRLPKWDMRCIKCPNAE